MIILQPTHLLNHTTIPPAFICNSKILCLRGRAPSVQGAVAPQSMHTRVVDIASTQPPSWVPKKTHTFKRVRPFFGTPKMNAVVSDDSNFYI